MAEVRSADTPDAPADGNAAQGALLEIRNVVKEYAALRPLRLKELVMVPGDVISVAGLDAQAAEMFSTLVTGASLPEEGEVRLFGRPTASIVDTDAWLALLDGVGIVSDRVILLDQFSVRQNLAVPFTLDIEALAQETGARIDAIAGEVGIGPDQHDQLIGHASADIRARVRLGRALALGPTLLIGEHPTATLPRESVEPFAATLAAVARSRQLALLMLSNDTLFTQALGGAAFTLEPATGAWRSPRLWQKVTNVFKRPARPQER